MQIQYIGSFNRTGTLMVYELSNPGLPWTIYMSLSTDIEPELPITPPCKVSLQTSEEFQASLPAPSQQIYGTFGVNKYRVLANSVAEVTNIYAHYGLIRAGGIVFSVTDMVAASDDNYLYEVEFYALDIPRAFAVFESQLSMYNLVQQLSFDVGSYEQGRRTALNVIRTTNLYPKLLTSLMLDVNDLSIICKDTSGVGAAKHIAMTMGIAEESISVTCNVQLIGLDHEGATKLNYSIIAANPDYGDETMHVILPMVNSDIIAAQVNIEYLLELQTIGEIIRINNTLVLTDEQLAQLRPLNIKDVLDGYEVGFHCYNDNNEPLENVVIKINGETLVTNELGVAIIKLKPGSYVYTAEINNERRVDSILVANGMIVRITFPVQYVEQSIQLFGTDNKVLDNFSFAVNYDIFTTNENGVIITRLLAGQPATLTAILGNNILTKVFTAKGVPVTWNVYAAFDESTKFELQFT